MSGSFIKLLQGHNKDAPIASIEGRLKPEAGVATSPIIQTFPVPMPDESAMWQRFWILEEHCGGGTSLRQAGVLHGQVIPIRVAKQRVTEPGGMGG